MKDIKSNEPLPVDRLFFFLAHIECRPMLDHALYLEKKKKENRKMGLPVFDGRQRDGCPAPQVAQIARLAPNVGRFVVASVARIFFNDADHQISNVRAVQVIEESDLELVGNPSGNEKKRARAAETWI